MITLEDIRLGYEYFYRKCYGNSEYYWILTEDSVYKRGEKQGQVKKGNREKIEKLVTPLIKHFRGVNSLYSYLCYQFQFWTNPEVIEMRDKSYSDRITPQLSLGKSGLERYENRDQSFDWVFGEDSDFTLTQRISREGFIQYLRSHQEVKVELEDDGGDVYRMKYYDTTRGLVECSLMTSMFIPTKLMCVMCVNKQECKEMLKRNLPEIYNRRFNDI